MKKESDGWHALSKDANEWHKCAAFSQVKASMKEIETERPTIANFPYVLQQQQQQKQIETTAAADSYLRAQISELITTLKNIGLSIGELTSAIKANTQAQEDLLHGETLKWLISASAASAYLAAIGNYICVIFVNMSKR